MKKARLGWKSVLLLGLVLANVCLWASVQLDKAYIKRLAFQIAPEGLPDRQIVEAMASYVREHVHHRTLQEVQAMPLLVRWNYLYNTFRPGPRTVLDYGTHHLGPCQSNTRALRELLTARGLRCKGVVMHDSNLRGMHSVLEVEYDGRWGVVSPTFALLYQHPDGRPATLRELRDDRDLFLSNAKKGWQYGWGPEGKSTRLPLPHDLYTFDKAYYFNYNWFRWARWLVYDMLEKGFGEDALYWLTRPAWYSYPAYTLMVCLNGFAALLIMAYLVSRRFRSDKRGMRPGPARLPPETLVQANAGRAQAMSGV